MNTTHTNPAFFDKHDLATYLGVSVRTIEDWRSHYQTNNDPLLRRGLAGIRIAGTVRYRRSDVDAAIEHLATLQHGAR